jgi:hypothetical protein
LPGFHASPQVSLSTAQAVNRNCYRHNSGFDLPDRRMITAMPPPLAVAK